MIQLIYFTGKQCGVCQVLKPKLLGAVEEEFPEIEVQVVDIEENPEFAAQNLVFTLPVVLITHDGKEYHRFARSFSVYAVLEKIERLKSVI